MEKDRDAVLTTCGHTFCNNCIEGCNRNGIQSPGTDPCLLCQVLTSLLGQASIHDDGLSRHWWMTMGIVLGMLQDLAASVPEPP